MRNALRTMLVCWLVAGMSVSPAAACHYCGGGGGYYSYGPVYYSSGYGCCGATVVYDSCDGCGSCGDCGSCEGTVVKSEPAPAKAEPAPAPPVEQPPVEAAPPVEAPPAIPPQQPAEVERPVDIEPAPAIPMIPEEPAATPPQTPPATPPAETTPAAPTTPPAETTPPATDDLFGTETPAASTPAETTPPSETTPPADTTPPAETTPPATDDLFDTPTEGTEKGAQDESTKDDLFGAAEQILREAGGLSSNELRQWVDNTGNYSCQGRLVKFLDDKVQLLKDNGRTTTVPLARLSAVDLEFVQRQASAQQATDIQTAQTADMHTLTAN